MTWEELLKQASTMPERRKATFKEEHIQQSFCQWMALQHPQWYQLLHHSPNGMRSNAKTGAIFKRMGTKAGFPDLFLFVPRGKYHGLAIEVKTRERNSRQSPEQKRWEAMLTEQGYLYVIGRDLYQLQKIFNEYISL